MDVERTAIEDYEWIHTWVGVAGNCLFFTGSILFLWSSMKTIGVWLFIVGSGCMLVGSVGSALVQRIRAQRRRERRATSDTTWSSPADEAA